MGVSSQAVPPTPATEWLGTGKVIAARSPSGGPHHPPFLFATGIENSAPTLRKVSASTRWKSAGTTRAGRKTSHWCDSWDSMPCDIACGVPGHAALGAYLRLTVTPPGTLPTYDAKALSL